MAGDHSLWPPGGGERYWIYFGVGIGVIPNHKIILEVIITEYCFSTRRNSGVRGGQAAARAR